MASKRVMSISWRFALALGGGILLVHMSFGYVRFHREKNVFQDGAAQDQKVLGRSLALAARRIWTTSGQDPAMDFVAHADHLVHQKKIRVGLKRDGKSQPGFHAGRDITLAKDAGLLQR